MKPQLSTFIIVREDVAVDPQTVFSEGLMIGRQPNCELYLNHPTVSRIQAGINQLDGRFYIFNLSRSNATTLNGRVVEPEQREALADGDVVQIGPFLLHMEKVRDALRIRVTLQIAINAGDIEWRGETPAPQAHAAVTPVGSATDKDEVAGAMTVFWEKRKREAGKVSLSSPLRPKAPPRLGKARFNWTPTRDLVRPWPFAIFTWGIIVVAVLSVAALAAYSPAFSPAPVSNAHQRKSFEEKLPSGSPLIIAQQTNGDTCFACHSIKPVSMDDNCASCHQARDFISTITPKHQAAGIGCIVCHTDHRGASFKPGEAAFNTCTACHNDNNKKTYNGKSVRTPHGGTFGYPVNAQHQWIWPGLDDEEWAHKPAAIIKVLNDQRNASGPSAPKNWQSAQFHTLHYLRVKPAIDSNIGTDIHGEVSCSSCHKTLSPVVDLETPRTTCARCHNGRVGADSRTIIDSDKPNCTSCHVQHVIDKRHWNPALLVEYTDTNTASAASNESTAVR